MKGECFELVQLAFVAHMNQVSGPKCEAGVLAAVHLASWGPLLPTLHGVALGCFRSCLLLYCLHLFGGHVRIRALPWPPPGPRLATQADTQPARPRLLPLPPEPHAAPPRVTPL